MAGGSDTQSGVSALGGLTGVGAVEAVSVAVADGVVFVGFAVAFVAVALVSAMYGIFGANTLS